MADKDIIEHLMTRPGQSQDERLPRELLPDVPAVDGRTPADLLRFLGRLAGQVEYQSHEPAESGPAADVGSWEGFFPDLEGPDGARIAESLLTDESGTVAPHLALLLAFLKLYDVPRRALNRFGPDHLDYFYRRVLHFTPREAVADRAHLVVELKKNAAPVAVTPEHAFGAGKDAGKTELVYVPTGESVICGASVVSIRSIYLDRSNRGTVRIAPIADSSDGVGGKLDPEEPQWAGFGHPGLPPASLGFAVASPVLRMREGRRTVKLTLGLAGTDLAPLGAAAVAGAFEAYVTGEKGWQGPYVVTGTSLTNGELRGEFTIPVSDGAVVDYQSALHQHAYAATGPVAQLLLRADSATGYLDLRGALVRTVRVEVEVTGVTSLSLENDGGRLDPKAAFMPFGAEPVAGSRFVVGYDEAFRKKLSRVALNLEWQSPPASFASHYTHYGVTVSDASFTASAQVRDGGAWDQTFHNVPLFQAGAPRQPRELVFTPDGLGGGLPVAQLTRIWGLRTAGSLWAIGAATRFGLVRPVLGGGAAPPPIERPGGIRFTLNRDFLHAAYRKRTMEIALGVVKPPVALLEPYTPKIGSIALAYSASSDEVRIDSPSLDDFTDPEVQFFHVGCFGQMREHAFQRRQFDFLTQKDVPLLPVHDQAGELVIGIAGLAPGGSISLLFQVAEGSADPDLASQELTWWVLCDNYWRALGVGEIALDTTNGLLRSGIVRLVIPGEATTENRILPGGLVWTRATVAGQVDAVSRLIAIAADAVEVSFRDQGNDPAHLATPLPEGRITKLRAAPAGVKGVAQPYSSFGGSMAEDQPSLTRRAAERLRHKNRCITAWDYERLVLESFPQVHRVKCISHARDGVWLAPGHVLLVVTPDLRNRNARDPLRPRVDADTISRIAALVSRRSGMQVLVHVKNPRYQPVQVDFGVRFRPGYEFNHYSAELATRLIRFLSPWAYDPGRQLSFGGKVYRSVLLDFVEAQPGVDYVTEFRMFSTTGTMPGPDLSEAVPATPDAILVSAGAHGIRDAR